MNKRKKEQPAAEEDFGFSSADIPAIRGDRALSIEERFRKIEELILPLLQNLRDTADKPTIHWPNRGPELDEKIKEFLKLTRGK